MSHSGYNPYQQVSESLQLFSVCIFVFAKLSRRKKKSKQYVYLIFVTLLTLKVIGCLFHKTNVWSFLKLTQLGLVIDIRCI